MAFSLTSETVNGIAKFTLVGELDAAAAGSFREADRAGRGEPAQAGRSDHG